MKTSIINDFVRYALQLAPLSLKSKPKVLVCSNKWTFFYKEPRFVFRRPLIQTKLVYE